MNKKQQSLIVLLMLFTHVNLVSNPLDSYGFRSESEKRSHRKLEGSHLDKKYEIFTLREKTKNKLKKVLQKNKSKKAFSFGSSKFKFKKNKSSVQAHTTKELTKLKSIIKRAKLSKKIKTTKSRTKTTPHIVSKRVAHRNSKPLKRTKRRAIKARRRIRR